jgi:hypothetical protein
MPASPSPAPSSSAVSIPRRRRRLFPSSKPNGHLPSFAPVSFFPPPPPTSPSPFHRFLPSPLRSSSVPFSWEHRPGIPKTPARARSSSSKGVKALPLPPSLLSRSCAGGGGGGGDPYGTVVPAEYAATHHSSAGRLGKVRRSRRPRLLGDALAEWLSLYRSCKRAAACFASKANKKASAL